MGWEKRGQNLYYYRKVRRGGRAVSQYCGQGVAAVQAARFDAENTRKRLEDQMAQRLKKREQRAAILATDRPVQEFEKLARAVTRAELIALGYHLHQGQWRRRRVRD